MRTITCIRGVSRSLVFQEETGSFSLYIIINARASCIVMNHISIEKDPRHTDCKRHHNAYPATPQGILIKGGSPDTKAAKTVQGLNVEFLLLRLQ